MLVSSKKSYKPRRNEIPEIELFKNILTFYVKHLIFKLKAIFSFALNDYVHMSSHVKISIQGVC